MYPRSSRRPVIAGRSRVAGAGRRSSYRRASSGVGPGVLVRCGEHSQTGRLEPGVGGDVVGQGGEGEDWSCLGSPGAHSLPVRSAGPRPVWSTGL